MTDRTLEGRIADGGETSRAIAELRARLEILERQPRYGVGFAADPSPTPEAPEAGGMETCYRRLCACRCEADGSLLLTYRCCIHGEADCPTPTADPVPSGAEIRDNLAESIYVAGNDPQSKGSAFVRVMEDALTHIDTLTRRLESAEQRHADETRELRAHLTAAEASATHWVTKALRERPRVTGDMVRDAIKAINPSDNVNPIWCAECAEHLNAALHPDKEADDGER
jgi:hypothetical protein